MKYLIEINPSVERANSLDKEGGPGELFGYIAQRFKPEAMYGNPTQRQVFLVVDLPTEADTAELMYLLTWGSGADPRFTPIMDPAIYMEGIERARKGPPVLK